MDLDNLELTDEARGRLDYIQEKISVFLEKIRDLVAYDLDSETPEAKQARSALDACVLLYAQGGVDEEGVEASARAFAKACRRAVRMPPQEPPSDRERWRNRPGNYQSQNVPKSLLRDSRNLQEEARRKNRGLYFVGETPPEGASIRDCIDGGLLAPGQTEGEAIAYDHRLAKRPKPAPYVPNNPVKKGGALNQQTRDLLMEEIAQAEDW